MIKASRKSFFILFFIVVLVLYGKTEYASTISRQSSAEYLTRAETAEIFSNKVLNENNTLSKIDFSDVPQADPNFSYINNVVSASLMKGDGKGNFMPYENITREQLAVVLYNAFKDYLENNTKKTFQDFSSISPWASEAVSALAGNDIAAGYPDGNFNPKAYITKPEFNIMMTRMYAQVEDYSNKDKPKQEQAPVTYIYKYEDYDAIINYENNLLCYVLYPVVGIPYMDEQISTWAQDIYSKAKTDIEQVHKKYPNAKGELNIQYNTYSDPEGHMRIELTGYLAGTWLNEPTQIHKVFSINPSPLPTAQSTSAGNLVINRINPEKPMVALTFDDGPSQYTSRLLNILKSNDAKGTFCVVGSRIASFKPEMNQIIEQGHEIMGHSWNHREYTKLTDSEIRKDLLDTNDAIFAAVNIRPKMYRAPYGSINNRVTAVSNELGLAIIQWSIDTRDWKSRNADAVYNAVMNSVNNGAIILTHEIHPTTIDALERIVPELKRRGYQLVTISELMSYSNQNISPGAVIYKQ